MSNVEYQRLNDLNQQDEGDQINFNSVFDYSGLGRESYTSIHTYDSTPLGRSAGINIVRGVQQKSLPTRVIYMIIRVVLYCLVAITLPVSIWFTVKRIREYEHGIIYSLGFSRLVKGPSVQLIVPFADRIKKIDIRPKAFHIPPFQVMCKDKCLVEVGAQVRYQIVDSVKACFEVCDLDKTIRHTAHSISSRYLQSLKEQEIGDVRSCNVSLKFDLHNALHPLGVAVSDYQLSGMKVILRVEQPTAIENIIEPLKQYFFGDSDNSDQSTLIVNPPGLSQPDLQEFASMFTGNLGKTKQANPAQPALEPAMGSLAPEDLLKAVSAVCDEELVNSVDCLYQFVIPDHQPSVYYLDLKTGTGSCGVGPAPGSPDTTLTVTLSDMSDMFMGRLTPFNAYMSGQLQLSGDQDGAMRLSNLLDKLAKPQT